jgi:hypothetical protein
LLLTAPNTTKLHSKLLMCAQLCFLCCNAKSAFMLATSRCGRDARVEVTLWPLAPDLLKFLLSPLVWDNVEL